MSPTEGITAEQVDDAIQALIRLATEHTLQERCTTTEAARIRLALQHPSQELQEYVEEAVALVIEALEIGIPAVLNAILYPDD